MHISEQELQKGEINFGREDSGAEDLDVIDEKVEFGNFDTDSLINEIRSDLDRADIQAAIIDGGVKKHENVEETFENLRKFCQA